MHFYYDDATGQKYDLSHLRKDIVEYVQQAADGKPERRYRVEVSYSDHCYTKRGIGQERTFDVDRYGQSKLLPYIVSELMSRECHHTGKTNFVTFDIDEIRTYEVYFEVFKKNGKLFIRVQSAYVRDADRERNRPKRAKIGFHVILYNIYHGKAIRSAK